MKRPELLEQFWHVKVSISGNLKFSEQINLDSEELARHSSYLS